VAQTVVEHVPLLNSAAGRVRDLLALKLDAIPFLATGFAHAELMSQTVPL
jgi:hypothetical protein